MHIDTDDDVRVLAIHRTAEGHRCVTTTAPAAPMVAPDRSDRTSLPGVSEAVDGDEGHGKGRHVLDSPDIGHRNAGMVLAPCPGLDGIALGRDPIELTPA